MQRIFDESEVPSDRCEPSGWPAIVPAAGLATRLGYALPKILYPIAGRPIAVQESARGMGDAVFRRKGAKMLELPRFAAR
jgi:hypothetical protein